MNDLQRLESPSRYQDDDEIDLLEIWHTLLKYRRLILASILGASVIAAGISLLIPNRYRAEVLIAAASSDDSKGGGLSSMLNSMGGSLGSLASMAGLSLGMGGDVDENLAVLQSRDFLWKFVQEKKLMPILFENDWDEQKNKWKEDDLKDQPGQMDVYRLFTEQGLLSVEKDKKTDLITVAVELKDPVLAADVANSLVERLNQYLAQQAIVRSENNLKYLNDELMRTQIDEMRKDLFDMIASEQKKAMLANAQKEFAFKVIDRAIEPDKKTKPKRTLIVLLAAFAAAFASISYALIRESMAKRREQKLTQDDSNHAA